MGAIPVAPAPVAEPVVAPVLGSEVKRDQGAGSSALDMPFATMSAKRQLQLMESALTMAANWRNRRSIAIGISKFISDWSLLMTNSKQIPPLH